MRRACGTPRINEPEINNRGPDVRVTAANIHGPLLLSNKFYNFFFLSMLGNLFLTAAFAVRPK
jgi:hypothetical protein